MTRCDRCEIRSSVRRKISSPSSQDDVPLAGQPLLDLLEHEAGVGLGDGQLPGMLFEQRLHLLVERLLALEVLHDLPDHLRQEDVVARLRPDQPLRLPAGEDHPADPLDMFFPKPHPDLPLRLAARAGPGETHSRKSAPMTPARRYLSIETTQGQLLSADSRARAAATAIDGIAFLAVSTRPSCEGSSIPSKRAPGRYGILRTPSA